MSHAALAKSYMDARLANKVDEALSYVADNIHFVSERDGTHDGRAAFAAYLKKTPPQGTWEAPVTEGDDVLIHGKVKFIGFIPVSVVARFKFDANNKITVITIGRK